MIIYCIRVVIINQNQYNLNDNENSFNQFNIDQKYLKILNKNPFIIIMFIMSG